jgi:integrase/recombinase XerD
VTLERELHRFYALLLARGRKPETVARYRGDVASLLGFLAGRGKEDLRELGRDDLVAYLLSLDRRLGRSTVRLRLCRLRRILSFLQRGRRLLRNPACGLARRGAASRMRDWLTEDEVVRLLETVDVSDDLGVRDRAALELLYASGLRAGELGRLALDDLDLAEGFVTVEESKSGAGRRVPVGRVAVAWLERYLRDVRPRLARRPTATVFLGATGTGRALHKDVLNARLRQYAPQAGIDKHVTCHVLRHSFAIHLLRNGASTRHIQAMLGHRSLEATQVYARVFPEDLLRVHRRCHPGERRP